MKSMLDGRPTWPQWLLVGACSALSVVALTNMWVAVALAGVAAAVNLAVAVRAWWRR